MKLSPPPSGLPPLSPYGSFPLRPLALREGLSEWEVENPTTHVEFSTWEAGFSTCVVGICAWEARKCGSMAAFAHEEEEKARPATKQEQVGRKQGEERGHARPMSEHEKTASSAMLLAVVKVVVQ